MTPETRASLEASIKRNEGYRPTPYRDSRGLWTTGFGHLVHTMVIPPQCITVGDLLDLLSDPKRHEEAFSYDIDAAISGAATCLITYFEQPENVQQVLAEMCYQLGIHGLANFRNMLTACRVRDYVSAAKHGLDSAWHTQTPKRAEELMALLAQ